MINYNARLRRYFDMIWLSVWIIVASLMALSMIKKRALYSDELNGIMTALLPLKDSLAQLQDYSAPLYPLILRILIQNEYPPEWVIRAPALMFAILGLIATWWFAKTLFNNRVAAITILFIAINPNFIRYAEDGRSYTMFLFLSVMSMTTFHELMSHSRISAMLAYVISTVCLIYAHYFGFLLVSAQILYALGTILFVGKDRQKKLKLGISFLGVFILSIPALWLALRYVLSGAKGTVRWIGRPSFTDLIWIRQSGELLGDLIWSVLFILAAIIALWGESRYFGDWREKRHNGEKNWEQWWIKRGPVLLCLFWVFSSLYLPVFVSYFVRPIYILRYGLPAMIPLIVIISYVISWFRLRHIIIVILVLSTLPAQKTYHLIRIAEPGYPELIHKLRDLNGDQSPVYVTDWPYCENFRNPELYGLRYYGYQEGEVNLITLRYPYPPIVIVNPAKLETDRRIFVVAFAGWDAVENYCKTQLRAYRTFEYGHLALFEIEMKGVQGRWMG